MLSVIIVNYFGKEVLLRCIESIIASTQEISYEIIIVDNAKDEQTKSMLAPFLDRITWIDMGYNSGFGRANNKAFEVMKGDAALLLNPDCIATDNALGNTYKTFMPSAYAACGIQLRNEDGSFQISGNYAMKGGLNYLLPLPYTGAFIKALGNLFKVKKPHSDLIAAETVVDWISGAFLMVRKETILQTGGFDEDFFLYAEEAEWCSRLRKTGPLCIYGDFSIIHLVGALSTAAFEGESNSYNVLHDKKGMQLMLSNMLRIRKEFGLSWFLVILSFYTFTIPVYLVCGTLHAAFTLKNQLKHFSGFSGNVFRLWKYFFKIVTGKPYFYKVL